MKKTNEMSDPAVIKAIQQLDLKPVKNGNPAVPQGSRQKIVETTNEPLPPVSIKKKKFSVELTTEQETRCIREAQVKGISVKEYLQSLVDEKLVSDVGRKLINGSAWMSGASSKKVIAPSNSFGREVFDAN